MGMGLYYRQMGRSLMWENFEITLNGVKANFWTTLISLLMRVLLLPIKLKVKAAILTIEMIPGTLAISKTVKETGKEIVSTLEGIDSQVYGKTIFRTKESYF